MSYRVEDLGKNMVKLTIEADAAEFEEALQKAYLKNKNRISVQGFRKGKAPRSIIEKLYGAGIFYEDAANLIIPDAYEKAAQESGLEIVSRPEIDVEQIEKGKPFIFTAEVAVKPEVTLGQYKEIEVEAKPVEVTAEELDAELGRVREQNSRTITVDDRAVEDGDITTIDYEGFADGVPFEGGKGENQTLVIGSHSFIDTFEEQLIGKKIGEEAEIHVTFPEDYHAKELAVKPAVFKVTVKEIKVKELPNLDDEFAQD
ncbi:MAG TPA: trigger factor, partial [Candidatus Caccomorpha excrementavium]|nr:trigger factor [Candidatus Caccomorpha excrementavium]